MIILDDKTLHDMFDEHLNVDGASFELMGKIIYPAEAYKIMLPDTYKTAFFNWLDCERMLGNFKRDANDNYYIDERDI